MTAALVVEDDPQVLSVTARYLARAGFEVATSDDFLEAAFQLLAGPPRVLIVDVRLGAYNGLQLAITARQQWRNLPIVVSSAWDDPVLRRQAAACQAVYMTKPFDSSRLLAAIRQASDLASEVKPSRPRVTVFPQIHV